MKPIAIILSGCGVQDGSEIHEAVCIMLAIRQQGATYRCYAPDRHQRDVINHLTGESTKESRDCLVEAARIARGDIQSLESFKVDEISALMLPGGFGAAKNLCDFAVKGGAMEVDQDIAEIINAVWQAKKPIGALCIAPVILAKLIPNVRLTLGCEPNLSGLVRSWGATHQNAGHGDVVIDEVNQVVTSPGYMLDATLDQIYEGASHMVHEVIKLMGNARPQKTDPMENI